ncbi:GW dipeptide domain-containing protein [Carnobacterium funditum]|uniref:GW dipeptide domain-containing protein n=1 Tax=Carnobacterium funditum TaxID=2752 RepID=UPI00054ED53C|nr:GW dipeptide domain-containing protein [Carnobacterium funditum]
MENWKKKIQKVIQAILILSMISPIFLATGVSAATSQAIIGENIEKDKVNQDLKLEASTKRELDLNIEESNNGINEKDLHNKDSNDKTIEVETSNEPSSVLDAQEESSNNNPKKFFSLKENRNLAIVMMENETVSSKDSIMNKFIARVSPEASNAAIEYNLSASVIIANAALESIWGTSSLIEDSKSFNLFGIKANETDEFVQQYVKKENKENDIFFENVNFKKYISFEESFLDYVKEVQVNSNRENKNIFENTTNLISNQYTDNAEYKIMLNNIIDTYNLTIFDEQYLDNNVKATLETKRIGDMQEKSVFLMNMKNIESINSEKIISYKAKINRKTDTINTKPYGTSGYTMISTSANYYGKEVNITKEAVTHRATWSYISGLGWIDKAGLDVEKITSITDTSHYRKIIRKTDSISTVPWGTEGYKVLAISSNYLNKQVKVVKEAKTRRATWSLITLNGKELGWIDKSGLTDQDMILSEKIMSYKAKINRKTDTINTKPYGTSGYTMISTSANYYGKEVNITKEAVTNRATWSYISGLGWIDKAGLDVEKITSITDTSHYKKISRKTDSISTVPWGTEGYKVLTISSNYLNKQVKVVKEAKTRRATWSLITLNGKELGWIDKSGLTNQDVILSEKTISYKAKINRKTDTINTKPYGTSDYKTLSKSGKYYGKKVSISKEAVTDRATWSYISGLGWIDKAGLDIEKVTTTTNTNYYRKIIRKTDSISTVPWGTEGYKVSAISSDYLNKQVKVVKEAKTRRATWSLITLNGKELGWIDKKGLLNQDIILSEKIINYKAKINRKTDTINTKPYGTSGYSMISTSANYYAKEVNITKEAVTDRATWSYISGLGWIDKAGLDVETIISQKNINYKARIIRSTDTLNTTPWGIEGYKTIAYSKSYFNSEITVIKEAKTRRAAWVLISFKGKELGWIDINAIKKIYPSKKVVVIDPGHGGKDPGAQAGGVKESDLNLKVAKKIQLKLVNSGYEVIMTRTTDKFLELSEIAKIANKVNPDIFVSVHTNSFNRSANGIETFSYNKAGKPNNILMANNPKRLLNSSILSQSIQNALIKETKAFDRKAKKANFHVVRETGMPAVLVEIGFVDNATERRKLVSNFYQEKLATGIIQGIQTYFSSVK